MDRYENFAVGALLYCCPSRFLAVGSPFSLNRDDDFTIGALLYCGPIRFFLVKLAVGSPFEFGSLDGNDDLSIGALLCCCQSRFLLFRLADHPEYARFHVFLVRLFTINEFAVDPSLGWARSSVLQRSSGDSAAV